MEDEDWRSGMEGDAEKILSFDDVGYNNELLRGIYGYGFEKPSLIQQLALGPISQGRDVLVHARSGTGKTAMYVIGLLSRHNSASEFPKVQTLVLVPDRCLGQSINCVIKSIGQHTDIKSCSCIGGVSLKEDLANLAAGKHAVVGTPGRILDLITRGWLSLEKVRMFILDDVDDIFSRGFKDQVDDIFRALPQGVQVCFFSSTLPEEVKDTAKRFMDNPKMILHDPSNDLTLEGIKQYYLSVDREEWKFETLCDLLECMEYSQVVIFCNTRRKVDFLAQQMKQAGLEVDSVGENMSQSDSIRIWENFRIGNTRILIISDIVSKSLRSSVAFVGCVLQYDFTRNREYYLFRIGRSGRFGRKGLSIAFANNNELPLLRDLEAFYQTHIEELPADLSNI